MAQLAMTSGGTYYCILSRYADVLQAGKWQLLKDLEDPELRHLADVFPTTVLHSRANSSTRKYLGAFKRWKAWAAEHHIPVFPAQAHHVALYRISSFCCLGA